MNTNELFEILQEELNENLMGEILLGEDVIIWNYDMNKNTDIIDEKGISEDEVEFFSIEEKLQEAHFYDIGLINEIIMLHDQKERWYFTEPTLNNTTIICDLFLIG